MSDGVLTTRFEYYDAAGRATVEESAGRRSTASYDGELVSSLTAPSKSEPERHVRHRGNA